MQNKNFLKDFIKLIKAITDRPGMYMINNVEDLALVIWGYKCACNSSDRELLESFMDDFKKSVNKRFETKDAIEWVRLIRFHGFGDGNTLNLFKSVFDEFIVSDYSEILKEEDI
jgi:hypothetical protein